MIKVKTFFLIILICSVINFSSGRSDKIDPNISNKTILVAEKEVLYNEKLQKFIATPNAQLTSGDILITANLIEYDLNQSDVHANGNVILSDGNIRVLASKISINLESGDFNASEVKAGIYPWAIQSGKIFRKNNNINTLDSSVYIFGVEENSPEINFKQVSFSQIDNSFTANKIRLKLGDQLIGKLPSFSGKVKNNRLKYKINTGKKSNLGWFVGTGRKWKINESLNGSTDIYGFTRRGILLKPSLSWRTDQNSSFNSGSIESGLINDQGDSLGHDLRGIPIQKSRFYFKANAINQINDNLRIAGQFEKEEDSDVFRDFQRDRFSQHQWNDSFGEISYQGTNWILSSLTRWQSNKFESSIEQMPNIRFDLLPTQLKESKIYNSLTFEFSAFREKGHWGQLLRKSNKLDIGYKIIRPIRLKNGLIFSPHFAYRRQDYSLNGPNANRSFGEWGNEIRYEVFGDYNWKNATWKIDRVRHSMNFSISHRKVNRLNQSRESHIPQIDVPFANLNLGPIDLMDYMESDALNPYQVVRIGWENDFLTKNVDNVKKLATLDFFQDLNNEKENKTDKNKEFFANLSIYPADWISFKGQSKIDVEKGSVLRNYFSTQITDGTINDFEIGYCKYINFSDQWWFSGTHLWSEEIKFKGSISYDSKLSEIPFWQTLIEYKKSAPLTWIFSISGRKGTAKENENEFSLSTRIFAF